VQVNLKVLFQATLFISCSGAEGASFDCKPPALNPLSTFAEVEAKKLSNHAKSLCFWKMIEVDGRITFAFTHKAILAETGEEIGLLIEVRFDSITKKHLRTTYAK
jgi:hypothetical protein